jgi:putative transcriptional regulator
MLRARTVLLASILALAATLCGQSRKVDDLAVGKVLVMQRDAPDPLFAESVILLIHYGSDGVVGLMLNQKSNIPLSEIREINGTKKRFDPAYSGGPVEVEAVTALVRAASAPPESIHVIADIYAVQSKKGLEMGLKGSKGPGDFRLYLGYCGWEIPQLNNEMALGSWYIFEHGERYVFDTEPHTLWKRLIDRTGGQFARGPAVGAWNLAEAIWGFRSLSPKSSGGR